ncbi:MAG: xanthine dehydrogenase family protein subunit M [Chloroflexi bacterium]|nr:xanthine dehydrogenase family protein subunit M [Chloroflexota bacterium]
MHPYQYYPATNLTEAVSLLSRYGERARVLAGGTDLLVQLRGERFEVDAVVDVKQIPEVMGLSLNGGLTIGAAVPCYQIYENEAIAKAFPGIIDAASLIGGIQVQSRASLGGNLCNATPSADGICPLIVHSAVATITGVDGTRTVSVQDFCTGPGRNVLNFGELLLNIQIDAPPAHFGASYQRFIPRNEMDIAIAGVAASVVLDAMGERIESGRIALSAVGPTPIFAKKASDSLAGQPATAETFAKAGEIASTEASPITDMRGTIDQRKHLVGVLTRRTLAVAVERARGNA